MRGTFLHFIGLMILCGGVMAGDCRAQSTTTLIPGIMPTRELPRGKVPNCIEKVTEKAASQNEFTAVEDDLCGEMSTDPNLRAIYAFVIAPRIAQVARVYKDKTVFTYYEDKIRYQERVLKQAETEALQKLDKEIQQSKMPDAVRDLKYCTDMCLNYGFIGIKREGGQRVQIFGQRYRPPAPLENIANLFRNFIEAGNFQTHYYIADKNKAFRVLYADTRWHAQAVWKEGDDWRLMVIDSKKSNGDFSSAIKYGEKTFPSESFEKRWQDLRRRDEIERAGYFWHKFTSDGNLAEKVAAPVAVPGIYKEWLGITGDDWQVETICKNRNECALFKVDAAGKLSLIKEGFYQSLAVSPDGRWAIAAKKESNSGWENLSRLDLQTKEEFPIELELSSSIDVVGYIAAHGKFLVCQRKFAGLGKPDVFNYFLIDGKTGKPEKIKGNFDYLEAQRYKPLQTAKGAKHLFWAAGHDYKGTTVFGLYDAKNFVFRKLAEWSDIEFDSDKMWVDEKEAKIYFIYQGQLLSLPLPDNAVAAAVR